MFEVKGRGARSPQINVDWRFRKVRSIANIRVGWSESQMTAWLVKPVRRASRTLNASRSACLSCGSLRGLAIVLSCFCSGGFVYVFQDDSLRVLTLHLGHQGVAVHVFPLADVSGLEWTQYEHRENIEELLKQGIGPGLDRIRKHGDVLKTSRHTDIRTKAQRAETFRHRQCHNVDLLISEVDVAFTGNDGIGSIEDQRLNAHLSILSLQI